MEICIQADITRQVDGAPNAPKIKLPDRVRWSEGPTSLEITLQAEPAQVARFLYRAGFYRSDLNPCLWESIQEDPDTELTVTVVASEDDWDHFNQALDKIPRSKTIKPMTTMHVEWPFGHPAFSALKAGDFILGDTLVRVLPEDDRILLSTPFGLESVENIKKIGYALHPLDEWQEEIWWDDMIMGRLLKPEILLNDSPFVSPWLTLYGMQNSLAHPTFMRPFLPPLENIDEKELARIITDTVNSSDDLQLAWEEEEEEEMEATFQREYMGFDPDDLDLLLRVPMAMTENLGAELFGDDLDDDEDEWMSQVFSLLTIAGVAGSRMARAELARKGYDVGLENRLGDQDCMDLANGVLQFADAISDAVGDGRAAHIWSLERRGARLGETILEDLLLENMPQGVDIELAACDLYLSFDLGVRYQMARVAPELLQVVEPPNELDPEQDPESSTEA